MNLNFFASKIDSLKKRNLQKILAKKNADKIFKEIKNLGFKINKQGRLINLSKKGLKIWLREEGSDKYVFNQVFIEKEYAPLIDCIKANSIEPKVIVDTGCNIGLTTLFLKDHFPNARYYCIEPDTQNFQMILKNLSFDNDSTKLINKAIWPKNEKVYLKNDFRDGWDWSKSMSDQENGSEGIEGITFNSFITSFGIDFIDVLKIDIEGGEDKIFTIENDLSFLDKVKILALEIHDEYNCRERIYGILREYNFNLYVASETVIAIKK